MPFALIAAVLASLGIRRGPLRPRGRPLAAPEPVTLQAEIVRKPRAVPVQQPAAAPHPAPARKPLPPRAKAARPTDVPAPVPAAEVAENPTPALPGAAVASPAEPPPAELALPPQGDRVRFARRSAGDHRSFGAVVGIAR